MITLYVGDTALPSPVSVQIDDEIIWSSDSGRDLSGLFSGDIVTEKQTLTVSWGILTEQEVLSIKQNLCPGYFPLRFRDVTGDVTIESYRGTLSRVPMGDVGDGVQYYKSASCKIVQR